MNDDSTRMLGDRYRLPADHSAPDLADTHSTRGLDTLSGHEVQMTRLALPETLAADTVAYGLSAASPNSPQADGPIHDACEAVRALTRLPDHPHLTQVFDVLIEGETLWIISEQTAARPLSDLLARKPPTPFRAAEIAREILRALRHLHTHGWLHRNLTADTVLICDTGSVLIDGLAQGIAEETLCGNRPRPLPHPRDSETARRTPSRRPEASAGTSQQTPPLPAGFTPARTGGGWAALQADAQRQTAPGPPPDAARADTSNLHRAPLPEPHGEAEKHPLPGPATPLEARRAREARIVRVGAITERWAPEQASPVAETWQLATPLGPAVDLWALGVLLFRALQGHAPYPEEDADELVAMVCAEPPAFAEDCGELRAVIESLLRQDPEQRPSIAEAEGWLISLLREAREPAPPTEPADIPSRRLPVLRFRGHLVRHRPAGPIAERQGRHRGPRRAPRRRGRTLLVVTTIPLALGATAYVALALSRIGPAESPHDPGPPPRSAASREGVPSTAGTASAKPSKSPGRYDPAGFQINVGDGWKRAEVDRCRVRFTRDEITLIVVAGCDGADGHLDPLDYQKGEAELAAYRADPDGTAEGVRRIDIGADQSLAEGQYTYTNTTGTLRYARNQAALINSRYHVLFVQGPATQRERITGIFNRAVTTYRPKDAQP